MRSLCAHRCALHWHIIVICDLHCAVLVRAIRCNLVLREANANLDELFICRIWTKTTRLNEVRNMAVLWFP